MSAEPEVDKTLLDLGWDRITQALAERCRGPLREKLTHAPIAERYEDAERALREAAEAYRLAELGDPIPLDGIKDVARSLERVERGGDLDGPELRALASTVGAARVLRRFLSRRRADAPSLFEAYTTDPTLDDLADELHRAIEPDGTLSDSASPELGRLRSEIANLRARIVARLEQLLLQHSDLVQDRFHTLREGRYVVPVRTDAHDRLPGIVHGTSASGATVFVEPRAVVAQGNRLKVAEAELERVVARILAALSARVRERLPSLLAARAALDLADMRSAAARLASDLRAVIPVLEREPHMRLVDARHPALVLDGVDVVGNDLEIASGAGLVVSGPNAGGKTVSLKLMGLAALMARAGLPIPAAEGSRIGFFEPVLTDIGDDQSLTTNLSTFSAHIRNVVRVLDATGSSALILLDELATGTDPDEGAALACAVLDSLLLRGGAVVLTTHYERLKVMGATDDRVRNASVGFDVAEMAPTFRVRHDAPGSSSALEVAGRFGMPQVILDRARALIPDDSRKSADLLRRLEERFVEVDRERAAAEEERARASKLREEAERALEELKRRDKKKLSSESEAILADLRRAKAELKEARRALRAAERQDEASLAKVREQIDAVDKTARAIEVEEVPEPPEASGPPPDTVTVGQRVYVPRLRSEVVVTDPPSKGRVRVAAGPVRLWVQLDELRVSPASPPAAPKESPPAPAPSTQSAPDVPERRTSDNTIDVRGMRVEDALSMTEAFLDRMFGASEPVGFILHGVGSGALRDAVRDHLGKHASQYVKRLRNGTVEEGGERWTVVYLK
ncbi:MAG: endonuclease MutS2 [Sandaracinaceae bacterium]